MKKFNARNILGVNNKGSALIFAFMTLSVLLTLSAAFAVTMMNELLQAKRHRDSAAAFWLAEAGINQFMKNTTMLDSNPTTLTMGTHQVNLSKVDGANNRLVDSIATVNGVARHLQIEYAVIRQMRF